MFKLIVDKECIYSSLKTWNNGAKREVTLGYYQSSKPQMHWGFQQREKINPAPQSGIKIKKEDNGYTMIHVLK